MLYKLVSIKSVVNFLYESLEHTLSSFDLDFDTLVKPLYI